MPKRKVKMMTRARRGKKSDEDFAVGDAVLFRQRKGGVAKLGKITAVRDYNVNIKLDKGGTATNISKSLLQKVPEKRSAVSKSKSKSKAAEEEEPSDDETQEEGGEEAEISEDEPPKGAKKAKSRVTGPRSAKTRRKRQAPSTPTSQKKKKVTPPRKAKGSGKKTRGKGRAADDQGVGFEDAEDDEEEKAEVPEVLVTPKKLPPKSPTHYRSEKKAKREWFTKEEVRELVTHVFKMKGEPKWAQLKNDGEKSTGLFGNRTSIDLKDKYRNLQNSGVAEEIRQTLEKGESIEELLDKCVRTPAKKENFHFRSAKKRKRVAWTNEEVACLTAGVSTFGTAWTKIKEEYSENLKNRTTLDLKDKWRNVQLAESRLLAKEKEQKKGKK